jgi:hypothetical protein
VISYDNSSDANTPDIYINGVKDSFETSQAPSGTASEASTNLLFGNVSAGNRPLNGRLDQSALWNKLITQEEVTDLYNTGVGLKYDY